MPPDHGHLVHVMGPAVDVKSRLGELHSLSWEVEIRTLIFKNWAPKLIRSKLIGRRESQKIVFKNKRPG